MRFNKILLYGVLSVMLGAFWQIGHAQCDIRATVVNNTVVFTLANPQPGSAYTWNTTTTGGTPIASGTIGPPNWVASFPFTPPSAFNFEVKRDGMTCGKYRVSMAVECEAAGFTTTTNPGNCSASFQPFNFNGIVWNTWNFGDGSPESYETAPMHMYNSNGTFNVTHWLITAGDGGGQGPYFDIARCNQNVVMNCNLTPTIIDDIECCRLRLRGFGQFPNCQHLWEVRPVGSSTVLYSSTAQDANWFITNINTNVVTQVDVFHRVTCNGNVLSSTTTTYSFVNRGIFVGANPNDPSGPAPDPVALISLNTATSAFNNQLVFTTATNSYGGNIFINSTLQIDRGTSGIGIVFNDANVCVSECAGINVLSARRLRITNITGNGSVHEGNCGAWRGIDVSSSGILRLEGTSATNDPLLLTVRGAMQAVKTLSGANFTANNTRFSNNYAGVFATGSLTSLSIPNSPLLTNTRFQSSGTLPAPCYGVAAPEVLSRAGGTYSTLRGFVGIIALNSNLRINGIPLGGVQFSALANGIWLENPVNTTSINAIVTNSTFNGITVLAAYGNQRSGRAIYFLHNGIGRRLDVTNNTVSNCAAGILAESQALGTVLIATGNNFSTCARSVDLVQGPAGQFGAWNASLVTTIETNRFTNNQLAAVRFTTASANTSTVRIRNNTNNFTVSSGSGIVLNSTAGPSAHNITVSGNTMTLNGNNSRGIELLNMRGVQVLNNTVNSTISGNKRGIYVENGSNNTLSDNTVFACNTGLFAQNSTLNVIYRNRLVNNAEGLTFVGTNDSPNNIRCNRFFGGTTGLLYSPTAITQSQNSTGNTWQNGVTVGARHEGDVFIVPFSVYQTPSTGIAHPGVIQTPNSTATWFDLMGTSGNCPENDPPPGSGNPAFYDSDALTATTGIQTGQPWQSGYDWVNQRMLHRKLKENPGLLSNATAQSFYNAQVNTTVGQFNEVEYRLAATGVWSASALAQMASLDSTMADLSGQITLIDSTLEAGGLSTAQEQALLDQRANLEGQYLAQSNQLAAIQQPVLAALPAQWDSIAAYNSAISATAVWEQNEKTFNSIYLSKILRNKWLNLTEYTALRTMAEQCVWEGGLATLKAQIALNFIYGDSLSSVPCSNGNREQPQTFASAPSDLRAFPNPSAGHFTLVLPKDAGTNDQSARLSVLNAQGQVVAEAEIPVGTAQHQIDLSPQPTGLYWVLVRQPGQSPRSVKVSLIK